MSLRRRLSNLEDRRPEKAPGPIRLHMSQPVAEKAGGGEKVKVELLPRGASDEGARYYYKESEQGQPQDLTKEQYDALPVAPHALPESDPRHKPRHTAGASKAD